MPVMSMIEDSLLVVVIVAQNQRRNQLFVFHLYYHLQHVVVAYMMVVMYEYTYVLICYMGQTIHLIDYSCMCSIPLHHSMEQLLLNVFVISCYYNLLSYYLLVQYPHTTDV